MTERLRWGILGTGNIARQFAAGLRCATRSHLAGVASRRLESAQAFAADFAAAKSYASYADLLCAPDVDAIYVSLPNSLHHEWTTRSLQAGKHVLCEKPFAATAQQASEMFAAAKRAGKVVMEAFMYRSHPQTLAILNAVRSGAIGEVRLIRTSFCYRTKRIADNVRFKAELAGGAMMDVGCYCLSFARLIAGAEPVWVSATGRIHESGVDEAAAGILRFPGGIVATFACGMTLQADNAASICGSDGYIDIPIPWKPPGSGARFSIARATPPRMDSAGAGAHAPGPPPPREDRVVGDGGDLYAIEADDFADAVFTGNPPRVSENDTLGNMRLLDEVRAQIGLKF